MGIVATNSEKFWLHRPVLITGATGLVGGWLVRRLLDLQADVICLIRDAVPQSQLVRSGMINRVKWIWGDVVDQKHLERVLVEYEIDTVFHLAAQTIVGTANRNPVSTFESNIKGTWVLLEACRRLGSVKQVVIASSDKAYGAQQNLPYEEDAPLHGLHPYDVSKSCADLLAQTYAHTYQLPAVVTRCGNFFGGGDLNWNRIVPGTIRSILHDERPIIRSDGNFTRDYFYVEDGAIAYTLLAEHLASNRDLIGQAFNFSVETQLTVLALVRQITELMGSDLSPDIRGEASNEIRHQYLSAAKAHRLLDWRPVYGMQEGLKRTISWYKDFLKEEV